MINSICAVSLDSPGTPRELLEKMIRIQSGEAPDEKMMFIDSSNCFGIASSGDAYGKTFFSDTNRGVAVAFSGRLINSDRLTADLSRAGVRAASGPAELLLQLYGKSGVDFIHSLFGSFNIALYDGAAKRILAFRDHAGFLPYYYSNCSAGVQAAASRIEALTGSGISSTSLDMEAIYHYLYDKSFSASETPFEEVKGIRPGHYLAIGGKPAVPRRYYKVHIEKKPIDEKDAIDTADAVLREVLEDNTRNESEIGVLLSGGVDSMLMLSMLSSITEKPIHTYSVFLDSDKTDRIFAKKISRHYKTQHHEIYLDGDVFRQNLLPLIGSYPAPAVGAWHIYLGSKTAGKDGVSPIATGFGGELVFGVQEDYWRYRNFHKILGSLDTNTLLILSKSVFGLDRFVPKLGSLKGYLNIRLKGPRWLGSTIGRDTIDDLMSAGTGTFRKNDLNYLKDYSESDSSDIVDMLLYDRMINFEENKIFNKCNELARVNGAELFHGFHDRRMLELGFSIPNKVKYKQGDYRHIEISLAAKYHQFQRTKAAFIAPLEEWMRSKLPPDAQRIFDPDRRNEHGIFKPEKLASLWSRFKKGDPELSWSDMSAIISLEIWLDKVLSVQ